MMDMPPSLPVHRRLGELACLLAGAGGAVCAAVGLTALDTDPSTAGLLAAGVALPFAGLIVASARTRLIERAAVRRAQTLDETSTDVLLIVDDDRIVQAGGATLRLLGCSAAALIGESARFSLPFAEPEEYERLLLRSYSDRPRPVVAERVRLSLHDGRTPTVDLVIHQATEPAGREVIVRLVDASDRQHLLDRLGNVGALDPVSGLANRERTIELGDTALHRARRTGEHLAVLAIHLEGLEIITDTFGGHVADEVVRASAARLASALRAEDVRGRHANDVFIAVIGGMIQEIGRSYAVDVADRITVSLARPIYFDGHELTVRPWVGVAHRSQTSGNPAIEDLLEEALGSMDEIRRVTSRWTALDER